MPVEVDLQQPARDELAEDVPPALGVELPADAEGRQPLVAEAAHLLGRLAAQQVDQVLGAEALAGAVDRRERLLRRNRRVEGRHRLEAGVAVAAGGRHLLAEVAQQHLAPALGDLAVGEQRVELARAPPACAPARSPRSR